MIITCLKFEKKHQDTFLKHEHHRSCDDFKDSECTIIHDLANFRLGDDVLCLRFIMIVGEDL